MKFFSVVNSISKPFYKTVNTESSKNHIFFFILQVKNTFCTSPLKAIKISKVVPCTVNPDIKKTFIL